MKFLRSKTFDRWSIRTHAMAGALMGFALATSGCSPTQPSPTEETAPSTTTRSTPANSNDYSDVDLLQAVQYCEQSAVTDDDLMGGASFITIVESYSKDANGNEVVEPLAQLSRGSYGSINVSQAEVEKSIMSSFNKTMNEGIDESQPPQFYDCSEQAKAWRAIMAYRTIMADTRNIKP